MTVCYGVQWIEVEFGQRDEGWALYPTLELAKSKTKQAIKDGPYPSGGGYLGPELPGTIVEIPLDALPKDLRNKLAAGLTAHSENRWHPSAITKYHRLE